MRRILTIIVIIATGSASLAAAPAGGMLATGGAAIEGSPGPFRSSSWLLSASPGLDLPLFTFDGSSPIQTLGWGMSLLARHKMADALSLRLGAGWSTAPVSPYAGLPVDGTVNEFSGLAGVGLGRGFSRLVAADVFAEAGAAYGQLSGGKGGAYGLARAGAGLDLSFSPNLGARAETFFEYKFGSYAGFGLNLALSLNPREPPARNEDLFRHLELMSLTTGFVFPVLRSYYDEHPFGTAVISNSSGKAMEEVRVSFMLKNYMDTPRELALIPSLGPGQSVEVPLTAIFSEELLRVTEPTKVVAELDLAIGSDALAPKAVPLLIQDRTALTWDDDRKAAAFVSSRDPLVLDLVGNINAAVRMDRNGEVPSNLQSAMAVHEGLRLYGIGYLLSPNRHFSEDKANNATVDNLKFPRQTLSFRSGDCADLSVLYASCLEAMGIETAFVTVPGHIFMAFDLGVSPAEAAARGIPADQLIVSGNRAWLPIETTIRDKGFSEVWQAAVKEYREASARQVAAVYLVHEAWQTYAPVGLLADGSSVVPPQREVVLGAFRSELGRIVQAEIAVRMAAMPPVAEKGAQGKALNDKGVLYGKYGLYADAERFFQASAKLSYAPALINLGNVALLKGDAGAAYVCYKQALVSAPNDTRLLVNVARAAAALGKSSEAGAALAALAKLDPDAANRYASLVQPGPVGGRAAEVGGESLAWF